MISQVVVSKTLIAKNGAQSRSFDRAHHGFTLIEIIVVMAILGVIASVGASRFANPSRFEMRGFTDQTLTSLRYAQRLASTSTCDVRVTLTSTDLRVSRWAVCQPTLHPATTTAFPGPDFQGDFIFQRPSGFSADSFDIFFDASGTPHTRSTGNPLSSDLLITIGDFSLTVDHTTGFTYLP